MTTPGERSEQERERARQEREARRAARADRVVASPALGTGDQGPRTENGDGAGMPARRRRIGIGGPIALVLVLAAVAVLWFLISLYQPGHGAGHGRASVTIPRGGGLGDIAQRLDSAGIISSKFFFELRARLAGHTSDLKPGIYSMRKDMSYSAVLDKLVKGVPRRIVQITIPEGRSRSEIEPLIKRVGLKGSYLRASMRSPLLNPRRYGGPHGATLEGFLFPATYQLRRGASSHALVEKQLQAFKQNLAKVGMSYARKKNLTPFDVVTIASMVEREAQLPRERVLIASVIYNRLHEHIPLGIDATIRYATGNWSRPLRVSQLHIASGYNTRTHQGLPPGPIGNPGLASLKAAAHPAHTHYLFYVVKPGTCGEHSFSSTDAQFQRDVARYNAARAKKGGKSPTTC